jgi:hypothetical protein
VKRTACLLALALLAAGCGGSGDGRLSKSQYEAKLQSALGSGATRPHVVLDAPVESLTSVASTFGGIASQLSKVRAPADVQLLNDRLVAGAAKAAATLNVLVRRIQGLSPAKLNQVLAEFDASHIPGLAEFNSAARALAAKGYRFSSSGGT